MTRPPDYWLRDWYKIDLDTIRGWVLAALGVVVCVVGFRGYQELERYYLERRVQGVIQEARELLDAVQRDDELSAYASEHQTAVASLHAAREYLAAGRLTAALQAAERGRGLLATVLRELNRLSHQGQAHFISVAGDVDYRRGERGEWKAARRRDPIFAGDYVKTAGNGRAEVMALDGTVYTVRSDTVILLGRDNLLSGRSAARAIALSHGWVDLSTARSASTVTTPAAAARVRKESTAVVTYDSRGRYGRFASYRGGMEISARSGATRRLRPLEQVTQRGSDLSAKSRLPAAPVPLKPSDNLELDLASSDRLALTWEPVAGATGYALQVARNRLFVRNIIDVADREGTRATLGLRGDGTFVWRVAARGSEGLIGPWSPARKFRVLPPAAHRSLAAATGAS